MDAIELLMSLFLNLSLACHAGPVTTTAIGRVHFQQLHYTCGPDKHFVIWQRQCEGSYWTRPFFLEETNSQRGIYLNEFGELVTGWHVRLSECHIPGCGT